MTESNEGADVEALDLTLERDGFMRTMLRELSGMLADVVGLDEASGFVSVVGQRMGRRIGGDFYVIEQDDERIVLGNRACPFAEQVDGRPALCMMTSNVFGSIAADNLGYAKVSLEKTIARGDPGCRIVVHLRPTAETSAAAGREYFRRPDEA